MGELQLHLYRGGTIKCRIEYRRLHLDRRGTLKCTVKCTTLHLNVQGQLRVQLSVEHST